MELTVRSWGGINYLKKKLTLCSTLCSLCQLGEKISKILLTLQLRSKTVVLTAAARSICPTTIAGCPILLGLLEGTGVGLAAAGTGGLAGAGLFPTGGFGEAGFAATGGGLGLEATGGGTLPLAGVSDFFQGVVDPLAAAIPGNTDTGLANASAASVGAAGVGTGRVLGGGGGAAGAALGEASSR